MDVKVSYTAVTCLLNSVKPYSRIQRAVRSDGIESVCFTDCPRGFAGWTIRRDHLIPELPSDLQSRYWKCLPHILFPDATHSIYCDASMKLRMPPADIFAECEARWPGYEVVAVTHPYQKKPNRWTVARECEWVRLNKHAPSENIQRQADEYRTSGWSDLRVPACGLLVRRHSPTVNRMGEIWWQEIQKYGHRRDQPSFPIAAHLAGVEVFEFTRAERLKRLTKFYGHSVARQQFDPE